MLEMTFSTWLKDCSPCFLDPRLPSTAGDNGSTFSELSVALIQVMRGLQFSATIVIESSKNFLLSRHLVLMRN